MTGKKFRVLLAEAEPEETAQALRALFPEPDGALELSTVTSIATLLPTIELAAPEAILMDLALGRPDPIGAVRRVHRAAPGVPLIAIVDATEKEFAARSISDGAVDYLVKGFMDTRTLERVLRTALERNTLEGLADLLRDPVTGLYNRDGLTTLGIRAMEKAMRTGGTLVLLCAMIENLSALHEEFGPGAREQAVREAAGLLTNCFRRSDFIARLGEAQFGALAIDAAEPSAPVLRQRVESRLAIFNQARDPWGALELRLSAGYWGAHDSRTFEEFLNTVETGLRNAPVVRAPQTGRATQSLEAD
jgi:diguanylate cyclase (GGDEF)-like protein